MAREPILSLKEVTVSRRRSKGVTNSNFSNGHVCLGESRRCFNCHQTWTALFEPWTCPGKCEGGCNGGCNVEADR